MNLKGLSFLNPRDNMFHLLLFRILQQEKESERKGQIWRIYLGTRRVWNINRRHDDAEFKILDATMIVHFVTVNSGGTILFIGKLGLKTRVLYYRLPVGYIYFHNRYWTEPILVCLDYQVWAIVRGQTLSDKPFLLFHAARGCYQNVKIAEKLAAGPSRGLVEVAYYYY
jgi:hypothetical protein